MKPSPDPGDRCFEALFSRERNTEIPVTADIYAAFLGSWDVRVVDVESNGTRHENRGEWYFARVLDGRAIQDIFIVPVRGGDLRGNVNIRYGATLRIYDPVRDKWIVRWCNPVTGAFNELIAHRDDGQIVQLGRKPSGAEYRWCFDQIERDSFHWFGETFEDGRWRLEVEFFATRQKEE